jgi:hypothetical protein
VDSSWAAVDRSRTFPASPAVWTGATAQLPQSLVRLARIVRESARDLAPGEARALRVVVLVGFVQRAERDPRLHARPRAVVVAVDPARRGRRPRRGSTRRFGWPRALRLGRDVERLEVRDRHRGTPAGREIAVALRDRPVPRVRRGVPPQAKRLQQLAGPVGPRRAREANFDRPRTRDGFGLCGGALVRRNGFGGGVRGARDGNRRAVGQ